jgi:hypothetical protein
MKNFSFTEAVIMCLISACFGLMIGSKTCTSQVTRESMQQIRQMNNTIDSISQENLALRIDLGRYEIIHSRLIEINPGIEKEITQNLE